MFKYYFERIDQVEIWPVISLSIFFIFFLCLILWVFTADKQELKEASELPIGDQQANEKLTP